METVLIVIHLMLVVALIGLVLLQKSEGGALGMGGGGGNGVFSSRGAANALTRLTIFCAAGFFVTSLALAFIATRNVQGTSIIDRAGAPISAPATGNPIDLQKQLDAATKAAAPVAPAVPLTSTPVVPAQKPVAPSGKQ